MRKNEVKRLTFIVFSPMNKDIPGKRNEIIDETYICFSTNFEQKKKKDVMQVVKNCFKMNYDKLFMLHLNVMFYNNAVLCVDKKTKNYVFKIRKQNILINGTKFNALTKLVILNNLM